MLDVYEVDEKLCRVLDLYGTTFLKSFMSSDAKKEKSETSL